MRRLYLSVYRPGRSLNDTWIGDMLVRLDSVMLFKRTVNSKLVEGFDCIIYYLRLDRCTIFYEHILPLGNDNIVELHEFHKSMIYPLEVDQMHFPRVNVGRFGRVHDLDQAVPVHPPVL